MTSPHGAGQLSRTVLVLMRLLGKEAGKTSEEDSAAFSLLNPWRKARAREANGGSLGGGGGGMENGAKGDSLCVKHSWEIQKDRGKSSRRGSLQPSCTVAGEDFSSWRFP